MNSTDLETFKQAIEIAKAGDKAVAHAILTRLRFSYPQNPDLLLWVAFTAENLTEARQALEIVILFCPKHPSLASAKKWLVEQEELQPQPDSPVADYFPSQLLNPLAVKISNLPPALQSEIRHWLKPDELLIWTGYTRSGQNFGKIYILTEQRVMLIKKHLCQALQLTDIIGVRRIKTGVHRGDLFFIRKFHLGESDSLNIKQDSNLTGIWFEGIPESRKIEELVLKLLVKNPDQSSILPPACKLDRKMQKRIGKELGEGEQVIWFGESPAKTSSEDEKDRNRELLSKVALVSVIFNLALAYSRREEFFYYLTNRRLMLVSDKTISSYCRIDPTKLWLLHKDNNTGSLVFERDISLDPDHDIEVAGEYDEMREVAEWMKVIFKGNQL